MLQTFIHEFSHLIGDSLLWLLIGVAAGAAVQHWMRREWVERWVGGNTSSVFTAALTGALLPGCSMATIPLAMGMRGKGGALGSMAAFILIAPLISPHTIFYAWALLGWEVALFKNIFPFLVALPMGWFLNGLEKRGVHGFAVVGSGMTTKTSCCGSEEKAGNVACLEEEREPFVVRFWQLLRGILPYYLGALLLAAAASAIWGENALAGLLGDGASPAAYLVSALVAIPVYVCDGGSIPLAAALLAMGASAGPVMTFLLAAETTCIPTIMMAPKIIGLRATVLYVLCGFFMAICGGMLFHFLRI